MSEPQGLVARIRGASRRRRLAMVVVAVLVVWGALAAWKLLAAASDLRAGARELRAARGSATVSELLEPEATEHLERARARFSSADDATSSALLAPARWVPVLGTHVRAVDHLASSGREGSEAALTVLDGLHRLERGTYGAGAARLELLRDLAAIAERGGRALDAIDPGSSAGLIGGLGRTVEEVRHERDDAARGAARLQATADGLADLLEGPETYLLVGANNAEMRAGTGMFLSAAALSFDGGHARLGDVSPTADLVVDPGEVEVEGDLAENWGWLDPGRDLRQLGVSADFPQSAAVAVRTWAAATGEATPRGVVVLDVDGIRALLRAVGPVEVDGVRYRADDVREELLREQYRRFEDDRDARRDQLGDVAKAIFDRIEAGDWDLGELATQIADAAAGRHLLVWSADPQLAATWADLGVDGHLSQDALAVDLVNRGANKLDSWVDTAVEVTSRPGGAGQGREVELRYTIRNRSTGEGPRYLVGPSVEGLAAGDYRGLVVVNLPAGTTAVRVDGETPFLSGGDGPTVVSAVEVTVPAGSSRTVVLHATLPAGLDRVVVEPAARIPPTRWRVDGATFDRDRRRTVQLGG